MTFRATQEGLQELVGELAILVAETADYHRPVLPAIAETLDMVVGTLVSLRLRLDRLTERYVIAFVGASNVGKSTLLNALLGADLAPRRNGPCTARPIEFSFGERPALVQHPRRGVTPIVETVRDAEEVHRRLASLAVDGTDEQVRKIVVRWPCELLREQLTIADTPGFAAAQIDSDTERHETTLREYLAAEPIGQVLWIVRADQGLMRHDGQWLAGEIGELCDDVVVTASEEFDANDRRRFEQRYQTQFVGSDRMIHYASGLQGIDARLKGDAQRLEAAGIVALERRLRLLRDPMSRLEHVAKRVRDVTKHLANWWSEQPPLPASQQRWRRDSLSRWCRLQTPVRLKRVVSERLLGILRDA